MSEVQAATQCIDVVLMVCVCVNVEPRRLYKRTADWIFVSGIVVSIVWSVWWLIDAIVVMRFCWHLDSDGITGPFQERLVRNYSPSSLQLMFYSNLWASGLTITASLVSGEVVSAIDFCQRYPGIIPDLLKYSLLRYVVVAVAVVMWLAHLLHNTQALDWYH
jgi:hypothetical protein